MGLQSIDRTPKPTRLKRTQSAFTHTVVEHLKVQLALDKFGERTFSYRAYSAEIGVAPVTLKKKVIELQLMECLPSEEQWRDIQVTAEGNEKKIIKGILAAYAANLKELLSPKSLAKVDDDEGEVEAMPFDDATFKGLSSELAKFTDLAGDEIVVPNMEVLVQKAFWKRLGQPTRGAAKLARVFDAVLNGMSTKEAFEYAGLNKSVYLTLNKEFPILKTLLLQCLRHWELNTVKLAASSSDWRSKQFLLETHNDTRHRFKPSDSNGGITINLTVDRSADKMLETVYNDEGSVLIVDAVEIVDTTVGEHQKLLEKSSQS